MPAKTEKPQHTPSSPLPWKSVAYSQLHHPKESGWVILAGVEEVEVARVGKEHHARLIVTAVNHHQGLVEALCYLANDVLDHFPALKEPQETCMGLAASYQNARAVLAQVQQD